MNYMLMVTPTTSLKVASSPSAYFRSEQFQQLLSAVGEIAFLGERLISDLSEQSSSIPDVVLLDADEVQCEEICSLVRANARSKVVVFCSNCPADNLSQFVTCGVAACCTKELTADALSMALSATQRGGFWMDSKIALSFRGAIDGRDTAEPTDSLLVKTKVVGLQTLEKLRNSMTQRDRDVLRMVAAGATNREIAEKLFISVSTVKASVSKVLEILRVNDRTEAAVIATKYGVIR